jgi:hypothetical protein
VQMKTKTLVILFGVLAVLLLPLTALWALFAGLAGDHAPLFVLRGKKIEDPIDNL